MYYYEVFIVKDDPIPDILQGFEKTMETRFHMVYEKAIPDGGNARWDRMLQELQDTRAISFFYWAYISVAKKVKTPAKSK